MRMILHNVDLTSPKPLNRVEGLSKSMCAEEQFLPRLPEYKLANHPFYLTPNLSYAHAYCVGVHAYLSTCWRHYLTS